MDKVDIKSLSKSELEEALSSLGEAPYRAAQIFRWLYKACAISFDGMSDIPFELRKKLKDRFHITRLVISDTKRSILDGTTKYLFALEDSNTIETVRLAEKKRGTICLSSQVGCPFTCDFCASARFGFVRNLTRSEMIDEVIFVKRERPAAPVTNLVFMGIGEPMSNYDNVMAAIRIFNDKDAFGIGARRITVSTCGIIPGIKRLQEEALQIELSVSLHSAIDSVRSKLLPINKRYPIASLIEACKEYTKKTNRVVTFEYILIKDVNSSQGDAERLARLLKGMKCKVNTIAYNSASGKDYREAAEKEIKIFINTLKRLGINATHRKSKGKDINAGCGQLRISRL